jgi:hypothetical protein
MQTHLADLHLLLYDFCGVMVLLATVVLIVVALLKPHVQLNEKLMESKGDPAFRKYPFFRASILGWGILYKDYCCAVSWSE